MLTQGRFRFRTDEEFANASTSFWPMVKVRLHHMQMTVFQEKFSSIGLQTSGAITSLGIWEFQKELMDK